MSAAVASSSTNPDVTMQADGQVDERKQQALTNYRKALKNHQDLSEGLKKRKYHLPLQLFESWNECMNE